MYVKSSLLRHMANLAGIDMKGKDEVLIIKQILKKSEILWYQHTMGQIDNPPPDELLTFHDEMQELDVFQDVSDVVLDD